MKHALMCFFGHLSNRIRKMLFLIHIFKFSAQGAGEMDQWLKMPAMIAGGLDLSSPEAHINVGVSMVAYP